MGGVPTRNRIALSETKRCTPAILKTWIPRCMDLKFAMQFFLARSSGTQAWHKVMYNPPTNYVNLNKLDKLENEYENPI